MKNQLFISICLSMIMVISNCYGHEWKAQQGTYPEFLEKLNVMEGTTYLFNCKIIVDKIQYAHENIYWLSVFDEFRDKGVAISFKTNFDLSRTEIINNDVLNYRMKKTTRNNGYNVSQIFQMLFDFNGGLAEISYDQFYSNPYEVYNNIKCSSEL